MKRKAYIVPALEVHTITIQQVICNSITDVEGVDDITMGDETDPGKNSEGGANSRRRDVWYDEYEVEENEEYL